jgi:four helix bundle protein
MGKTLTTGIDCQKPCGPGFAYPDHMGNFAKDYKNLDVFENSMDLAMDIFTTTKTFPTEEKYSLVDQMRRSSRSVCANIAEAWRRRRYKRAFISSMNNAESEANETRVWLEIAYRCGYLDIDMKEDLDRQYDIVIRQIVKMIQNAELWTFRTHT